MERRTKLSKRCREMKELIQTSTDDDAKKSTDESDAPGVSGEGNEGEDSEPVDDDGVEDESAGDTIEVSKPKRGRPKGSKKKAYP